MKNRGLLWERDSDGNIGKDKVVGDDDSRKIRECRRKGQ